MKKLFISLVLIVVGAGAWWLMGNTARFSLKKWDAKFESTLRQQLHFSGLTNQDLLSSVHEIKKDGDGEWVVHRVSMKMARSDKRAELKKEFENAGADVLEQAVEGGVMLLVKRGARTYQEIKLLD